jgi:hypothetical protein
MFHELNDSLGYLEQQLLCWYHFIPTLQTVTAHIALYNYQLPIPLPWETCGGMDEVHLFGSE